MENQLSKSMPAKDGPKILVISASVGSGHNQAAKAVIEALPAVLPRAQVEFYDIMEHVPRYFRAYYAGGFALCMTRFPGAYGLGYWLSNLPNSPKRTFSERLRFLWESLALGELGRDLLQRQPDLIINTHFLAPPFADRLIQSGRLKSRQISVVTDVQVHRWWYCEGMEHFFVPSDYSVGQLLEWGVPTDRITPSGIPIRPKWLAAHDRQQIYSQWNLPRDRKIVLLSGGTEFTVGPIVKIAGDIVRTCPQACVVVLAGRNKQLLGDLTKLGLPADRLAPMGFTDRMPELMEVASLMVTKPGGVTTAECLSKGRAMVFLKPVPGQEGGNANFFEREGAGVITKNPGQVVEAVKKLLDNPAELEKLSANARRLFRPGATIVADYVRNMLKP